MALPENVGTGTVMGRFLDSAGDPIVGKVKFKASPKRLLNATAVPPVTILPKVVEVELVDGEFTKDLIPTNDPDNSPVGWNYTATFDFKDVSADPVTFDLPEGTTVDLTTVTPVAASGGVPIIRGPGLPDWSEEPDGRIIILVDGEPAWGPGGGSGGPIAIGDVTGLQDALDARPTSATVTEIWTGTQVAYDAIDPKDPSTLYLVVD